MNYSISKIVKYAFLLVAALSFSASAADAPSGLDAKSFKKYWHVESESPDYKISFSGDTAEIFAPKGLTLWRNEKMSGNTTIEYDASICDTGMPGDRLSDLNCFWMASDPKAPTNIRKRESWRKGIFVNIIYRDPNVRHRSPERPGDGTSDQILGSLGRFIGL